MKICPKCELNLIEDGEEYCPLCSQAMVERPHIDRGFARNGGETGRKFACFLADCGYKEVTDNGQPSTVYSYITAIEKVCHWENLTWQTLAKNIGVIVKKYDFGGTKEAFGNQSHRTVYNALVAYSKFIRIYKVL